ncbi:MAG: peptidoglycan-binding protein [Proteobacteria bacterium]|nr:peptidoglycan-binding protein [Pseudomonadota bacterium]
MLLLLLSSLASGADASCATAESTAAFNKGFAAQQAMKTDEALQAYLTCLELDPDCVSCNYEVGWTYWSRSEWGKTIAAWEKTLTLDPNHNAAATWLTSAKDAAGGGSASAVYATGLRVPLGIKSKQQGPLHLELTGRFQNYNAHPADKNDIWDNEIYSPKSARFLSDGSKVYVNSLEGFTTGVFDPHDIKRLGIIRHEFGPEEAGLFKDETSVFGYPYNRRPASGEVNQFKGKPVESTLSHKDRYLWTPYYRRDYDYGATSPSAVAIIDTQTDQIVRIMPTGPVPKYVVPSPDNHWLAVTHWGDNTLGVIDISSQNPDDFKYLPERLVVEKILDQTGLMGTDRDATCGYCLRGTAFTNDSKTLLVARMGSGGIAGFDVDSWEYLGTVTGEKATPRHLVVSKDSKTLFLSSSRSGHVSRISLDHVLSTLRSANGQSVPIEGWKSVYVGGGARTIELSPDERYIYTAVNSKSELVAVDAENMTVAARLRSDSFTVGLAVSPDGKQVWTTSQGRNHRGGNSVCVYTVTIDENPE